MKRRSAPSPTRVQRIKRSYHPEITGRKLLRACQKLRRTCVLHLRDVSMVQNFGPTTQRGDRSRGFSRWASWPSSAATSFKKASSGSTKYSDNKTSSSQNEKLREPMIKCKHLFICSGATLIRSIVYTSDKRMK